MISVIKVTKDGFSLEIEKLIAEKNMEVMEAIVHLAQSKNIELETVPKLLTQRIKEMLESEAHEMNLLTTKRARLTI